MEVHKNTFDAGFDTNISKNLIPANKYIDANNVNLVASGNFFALENIQGTTSVQNILPVANTTVLTVFASKYKIGNTFDIPCLTIVTATNLGASSEFNIFAYDTQNDILYELYEEVFDGTNYFSTSPCIDGILYPENGFDIIYFTDNFFEIRKLRCEIPISYSANFLTFLDLKLLQHGANGKVELASVVEDAGSLFCGSYQFAYQFVNPETNQFSKFSLFCNPVQIYLKELFTSTDDIKSGVGLQSGKKILLDITPSEEELDYYTHFRLAVIENIEPSGVLVDKVYLTQLDSIATYSDGTTLNDVPYATNVRIETMALSDIVVDKAAISTIKTIAVRQNKLIGGNVIYKNLDYDNGNPSITGGSILRQGGSGTFDNLFSDSYMSSKYRGHFREEVYRYAISYFDEDGNFSFPKVLDLSSVTHNQISGAFNDMKFPARSQKLDSITYGLFKSGDGIQSLGLQLEDINNHPTWARGFIILRANRLKNVLFQTPIVPLNKAYGIGALEEYPFEVVELSGTSTTVKTYTDAQPMGPFSTYIPRNYFWLNAADINMYIDAAGASGGGVNKVYTGEARLSSAIDTVLGMVFPPSFMYEDTPYTFNSTHKIKTVDAALLRGLYSDYSNFTLGSATHGRNIKTSVSGTFYALSDSYYYYDSAHSGAKAGIGTEQGTPTPIPLSSCEHFTNLANGSTVGGLEVFRYDKMNTDGVYWGIKANVQKTTVVGLSDQHPEINYDSSLTFAAGAQIARPVDVEQEFYLTDGNRVHTVEIINILSGLPDDRYGREETPHDFISTGTIVTFTDAELVTVRAGNSLPKTVDVWGGDCYVAPHLFKISDTVYGVSNSEKFEGTGGLSTTNATKNWEKAYLDIGGATVLSIPVPYKNASQYLAIIMESEYNAGVMDNEVIKSLTTIGSLTERIPVYGLDANSENLCRVPLTYKLNQNHKKQNSDKIFAIKDPLLSSNVEFNARLVYSDTKVYQTSINGFDSFRVLNFHDLEETYGDVIKLQPIGDDLYAFQEKAISYIGIGERVLETTDALTLSVQSGTFVGNVILVDNRKGTQHIQSVLNSGNAIYFIDNINQTVNRLSGKQVDVISEKTMGSAFRTALVSRLDQNKVKTIYDPIRKQLLFVSSQEDKQFCYVFDEARNFWVSNYSFPESTLFGGIYQDQQLYLVGKESTNISIATMYTGDRTYLFGNSVIPSVTFVANPDMELGKVFDDLLIVSTNRLDSASLVVPREVSLGDQTASGITLDVTTRGEGNYRAKILRDSGGARLRGPFATVQLLWDNGVTSLPQAALSSVLTKYRISENKY